MEDNSKNAKLSYEPKLQFGIHPDHQEAMSKMALFLLLLAAIQLLAWLLPTWPEFKGIPNYLPLHVLLETGSIILSMMVFAVGWNSRSKNLSGNVVLLACVYFSVGVLDFLHTISYVGMPDFISPNDAQKHLNYWLASRLFASLVLLIVAIRPWKPLKKPSTQFLILGILIVITWLINWIVVYHQSVLPDTFIVGKGLTPFKKNFEYAIIAINVITAIILWRKMRSPQTFKVSLLFAAVCTLGMSEFFFTLYTTMTGSYNVLGHIYKFIADLFIYRAIVVEVIEEPYAQLKEAQEKLSLTLKASNTGLWSWNLTTNELYLSPEWKAQLGFLPDELPNQFSTWESLLHPDDRDSTIQFVQNFLATPMNLYENEFRLRHKDGTYHWILARGEKQLDASGHLTHLAGSHVDISDRKLSEEKIERLAFYDQLTLLPNRRLLIDRIQQTIASIPRTGKSGALLFIDLDNFKTINDTLGHDMGDLLLQKVAERLSTCVREGDTVSRMGGDEFVVLLENLSEIQVDAAAQAKVIASKILSALNRPYQLVSHSYHNTPSIGITLISTKYSSEECMKQADIAMYQAKNAGRNTLRFFDLDMQASINARAELEAELRSTIENQQFLLYYQVQVDTSRHAVGAEALIRWAHPERGIVTPASFIPHAEEVGLINHIGKWVLDTACAQLKLWETNAMTSSLTLSVNVSAKQFHEAGFVEMVKTMVQRHAIKPSLLKLEPTEGILLENIDVAISIMNELKDIGVHFALDDFGTGYSSLQYLKKLPLNQLKIDQSFVRDLAFDDNDQAIVRTIIAMARSLNLGVVAEGVETEEQLHFLQSNGCTQFQGYLFGKPVPIAEFEKALNPI